MSDPSTAFTLDARPGRLGVDLFLTLVIDGQSTEYGLALKRDEARAFAARIMACAGDGTERTFTPEALLTPAVVVSAPVAPPPEQASEEFHE